MKKKDKVPASIRTYDKDGFRRRAACVCVKDENESDVLLVSRTRRDNEWIFPGGGIEPREDPRHAASRDVVEEAGVIGSIVRCLGIFEVAFFAGQKRMWVTVNEAESFLGENHTQTCYLYRLKSSLLAAQSAQTSSACPEPALKKSFSFHAQSCSTDSKHSSKDRRIVDDSSAFVNRTFTGHSILKHTTGGTSTLGSRSIADPTTLCTVGDDRILGKRNPSNLVTTKPTMADFVVEGRHDGICCPLARYQNGSLPSFSVGSTTEIPKQLVFRSERTFEKESPNSDSNSTHGNLIENTKYSMPTVNEDISQRSRNKPVHESVT